MIQKRPGPSIDDIEREADRYRKAMSRWQERARHWEREFHALAEAANIRTTIVQDMTSAGGTTAGYEFWTYALGVAQLIAGADAPRRTVNGTRRPTPSLPPDNHRPVLTGVREVAAWRSGTAWSARRKPLDPVSSPTPPPAPWRPAPAPASATV